MRRIKKTLLIKGLHECKYLIGNEEVHSSILCGSTIFPHDRQFDAAHPRATSVMCAGLRPTSLA